MRFTSLLERQMSHLALGLFLLLAGVAAQAQTVLVLGDSLSAGYGMAPEDSWVHLLGTKLGDGHRVVNASISGETSRGGRERLPGLLAQFAPGVVLLELGANDGLRGYPIQRTTDNLRAMIEQSRQAGARVILLGIRLPPNFGSRYTDPFYNQYAQLAKEYDLLYLPFLLDGVAQYEDLMQNDGLHPTAEAQPRVLDNVWPLVRRALGDSSS